MNLGTGKYRVFEIAWGRGCWEVWFDMVPPLRQAQDRLWKAQDRLSEDSGRLTMNGGRLAANGCRGAWVGRSPRRGRCLLRPCSWVPTRGTPTADGADRGWKAGFVRGLGNDKGRDGAVSRIAGWLLGGWVVRRYGVAVHGAGWVAAEHVRAFEADARARVVAISSRRAESAARVAEETGHPDALIETDLERRAEPR